VAAGRDGALSDQLDREWYQLSRRAGVIAAVRGWGLTGPGEPPIADLDDLLRRLGYWRAASGLPAPPDSAAANAMLARLLARASTDLLAARIVLQRILPGLLSIVRAEQHRNPRHDAFDALIAEAWCAIVGYDVASRGTSIASRLLSDARHHAFTNERRRLRLDEVPLPAWAEPRHRPVPSALEELTDALREARRAGVADGDLDVLRGLLRGGSNALAAELGVTSRTIRNRRQAAVAKVRDALGLDDAA